MGPTADEDFAALGVKNTSQARNSKAFSGLHIRITQLHDRYCDRFGEVMKACAVRPKRAADIFPLIFRLEIDLHQKSFAMGETLAHLHLLRFEEKLLRLQRPSAAYR